MPQSITLIALGSRGDVQPLLALSLGLKEQGFDPILLAGSNFQSWIESFGIRFASLGVDIEAIMNSDKGLGWTQSGGNPLQQLTFMRDIIDECGELLCQSLWQQAQSSELLISGFVSDPYAQAISEKLNIPRIVAMLQPYVPTRSGTGFMTPLLSEKEHWANKLLSNISLMMLWTRVWGPQSGRFREQLGLPKMSGMAYLKNLQETPGLLAFSDYVVPRASDWGDNLKTTGYWFLNEQPDWQAPPDLQNFLETGPAPIYIGFGSMTSKDPQAMQTLIFNAIHASDQRLILSRGWANLAGIEPSDRIFTIDATPHHWLFPRMQALIHHGGAGTTAETLRAGKPSLIVPHLGDQPYWGKRVYRLGVGLKPIPQPDLTEAKLVQAIHELATNTTLSGNARQLGEKIRTEQGITNAVQFIKTYL